MAAEAYLELDLGTVGGIDDDEEEALILIRLLGELELLGVEEVDTEAVR